MRTLIVMLGLILAGCGGTTVVVVTATPEPTPWIIVVTATPEGTIAPSVTNTPSATNTPLPVADPTPTREVATAAPPALNPHEACARAGTDCTVSALHTFQMSRGMVPVDTPYVGGRPFMTVCGSSTQYGQCYEPVYEMGSVGAIPFTYCTPGRDACRMEIHWWDGVAGYCQSVDTTYSRQPYLIKVTYDYRLVGGGLDGVMFAAYVVSRDGTRTDLPKQAVSSRREALWAVRSVSDYPDLRVCAYIYAPWAVYSEGWIDWIGFEVIALPEGYAGAVIEYD